jgi:hypothetical protein
LATLGLRYGESVDFTIRGRCMPGLADQVRVRRQRIYVPGDVVIVRRRDHFTAHRFLGYAPSVHGIVVLTRADDAARRDPAALVGTIVGRAEQDVTVSQRLRALRQHVGALIDRLLEARQ